MSNRIGATIFLVFSAMILSAQSSAPGTFTLNDQGVQGLTITWQPDQYTTHPVLVEPDTFQFIRIGGLSHTSEVGRPALPQYHELIAIPQHVDVQYRVVNATWVDHPAQYRIHPALEPATDTYGAAEPAFEIDEAFYQSDQFYPSVQVALEEIQHRRELAFGHFSFYPVQYNPVQQILRVFTMIEIEVSFPGGSSFLDVNSHSKHFLDMVARPFLNRGSIQDEIDQKFDHTAHFVGTLPPDFILITHSNYLQAAERLAKWKEQLGHRVEVIDGTGMTSAMVKSEVHTRFHAWTPKPDFLLIIGDHPDIPGEVINGQHGAYASDHYYVCTGPPGDFIADMAKGRISVANATQAHNVVSKIIDYETNPPNDPLFYSKAIHAAYFQHAGNGFAERRFAQTAEELRDYMINTQSYDVTRVYVTGSSVNPTNWNNGLYAAGEPVPTYLQKPTFPWNGSASHITSAINGGASYVLHRDHGSETLWGDPYYTNNHISALNNGNKTPIVFTINCLTGKFLHGECFSERFLRKYPGGAVGVFGHAEISYSGFNDALAFGIFDAIWASPGCLPTFTGSGGLNYSTPPPHDPILTMGDVTNHATLRMNQTWGTNQYTHSLFHYFGDPAMRFYTRNPTRITATHNPNIQCGHDTTFSLSANVQTGLVTLMVDHEVVSVTNIANGFATLVFPQLAGNFAILTISDTNAVAYVDTILITGGCPKSVFDHQANSYCVGETVTFSDNSSGAISSYQWNFGVGAIPPTATGQGPHNVTYSQGGIKTITLMVTGSASHTSTQQILVDPVCQFALPVAGNQVINHCEGLLKDDGGDYHYSNNANGSVTISPPGAVSVNLLFNEFNFEKNVDYLNIYDGPTTAAPLIGSFTGDSLPGYHGLISSSTGSITLQQVTNAETTFPGFEAMFYCAQPNTPPHPHFILTDSNHCSGAFSFVDLSFNNPQTWSWDFGDGNTSAVQNPQHQYQQNGTFNVTLTISNQHGVDSLVRYGFITVNRPLTPNTSDVVRCKSGNVTLTASSNGTIEWFDQPTGGTPVSTGPTFITPSLSQNTTYYVESSLPAPLHYGGKTDNNGGGGFLGYEHYLVFDALVPFTLNSVKVYAQSGGNRTIRLQNSNGGTLQTATLYIPAGESRITLNFEIPVANNLRLVGVGSPNLYRNNSGLAYPYELPGILSIHSSSAGSDPTGYYYFFYEWEVAEKPCRSDRVPVQAILSDSLIPTPDFSFTLNTNQVLFANQSTHANSYLWDFGDGGTSTLHNPFYVYQAPGTWVATLTANNACGTDSISRIIDITTGMDDHKDEITLKWYPNPANERINIYYFSDTHDHLIISFRDPSGRIVKERTHAMNQGVNILQIDLSEFTPGLYLLQFDSKLLHLTDKLIIGPVMR